MVNPTGVNGYENGTVPPEDQLIAALQQYARERLSLQCRIQRLGAELNYHIKRSKLKQLNAKYNIPTSRKPPPLPTATTLVCEQMGSDLHRRRGPDAVKAQLALEGFQIPRAVVRAVMHDNDTLGPDVHDPRSKTWQKPRAPLVSYGSWHELSVDGHEKLGDKALQMGLVGFHIYGGRDKWSGKVIFLVCLPDSRHAEAIGHVYLDFVAQNGLIPIQVTYDGGSETPNMRAIQEALRKAFAPEVSLTDYPPYMPLPSTRNIVIENLWSRWLTHEGWNIQATLFEGKTNGLFNQGDYIDINLFQWLWSQIIQIELDAFKLYWNSHRVRRQRQKQLPSGSMPNDFFATLEQWGGQNCGISVDTEVVKALRKTLDMPQEDMYKFVDDEFRRVAEDVYVSIGSPKLTVQTGWHTFSQMKPLLRNMYRPGM